MRSDVELLVADAYFGILRVNTASGNVTTVLATGAEHPDLTLLNDLDVTADGATAYFSNTGQLYPATGWMLNSSCFFYVTIIISFEPFVSSAL